MPACVGGDRGLKRLSRTRGGDLALDPPTGNGHDLPRIQAEWTLRDALSEIIGAGADRGVVVQNGDGASSGTLTLNSIREISHGAGAPRG